VPTPIDPKRLPGLKKALEGYSDGDWLAQRQLAELYGVSNARMTTLIKSRFPDFPAHERRDDKTHWYPARASIASMIAYMENSSAEKQAQARRHTAVMSGVAAVREEVAAVEPAAPPALSAGELDRLASAQTRLWKLQREQGMFVPRDHVVQTVRGGMAIITRNMMGLESTIDPNGELPPDVRARIARRARDLLMKLNEQLAAYLEDDHDEPPSAAARARAGADPDRRRRTVRESAAAVG
jgi:hypothetical protein